MRVFSNTDDDYRAVAAALLEFYTVNLTWSYPGSDKEVEISLSFNAVCLTCGEPHPTGELSLILRGIGAIVYDSVHSDVPRTIWHSSTTVGQVAPLLDFAAKVRHYVASGEPDVEDLRGRHRAATGKTASSVHVDDPLGIPKLRIPGASA